MRKFVLLIVGVVALSCLSCTKSTEIKATDEVVFTSASGIPADFGGGTFFWQMPKVEKDATLQYDILLPDGRKYFQYTFEKSVKPGTPIRSDFKGKIFKGKHKQPENSKITVKIRVDKGKIEFLKKPKFTFGFHSVNVPAVQEQTEPTKK